MRLDEGLDTGPVLAQWETSIGSDESAGRLTDRLAVAGAELLTDVVFEIAAGEVRAAPQDDSQATYASRIEHDEARLDLSMPAADLVTAVRAYNPRPGAFAMRDGDRFKVLVARRLPGSAPVGRMVLDGTQLTVGTGEGRLDLVEVQPAGSRRMEGLAWARGVRGELGTLV